ncbi:MAG: hypothetical protein K1X53_05225, partial [Candidatus Sumerlaeaceae bacterium]|nr:hypothetical protein [Candidatus Sumerlaeaceae bacterium]
FILLFMLVGILAGGAWAAIPGTLKAVTGAHEVITTIMMNFIAYYGINYLVRPSPASFAVPATLHTVRIPESLRMPRLSEYIKPLEGSQVNGALVIALLAALAVYILLWHTRLGFEMRAVGQNPTAARLAGISPGKIIIISMFLSGGLASLVGVDFVLGLKGYFEENFSAGAGFIGIAVALLANNHPIGVIFTAFLFGVLNYGKVAAGDIPKDIIDIIQAAIIFSMILGTRIFNRMAIRLRKRAQQVAQQRQEADAAA